jgi:amino acid transporter
VSTEHSNQRGSGQVDDALLQRFGYSQQFVRTLKRFESSAVAFSFISITTGIFTTFAFLLTTSGPRGIWTWPIVIVGQTLVAMVYAALAAKIPLSGYSYQWASRLANPVTGWWLGWLSFAFLCIVTVSVDYGFESASNLSEETQDPRSVVPGAMVRSVVYSGLIGMFFLIMLTVVIDNLGDASQSAAPVAFVVKDVLGGFVEKLFLLFICFSIFSCGMVIMVTNSRLTWAMARDRRLPGHQLLSRVPRATGGPSWATVLVAAISAVIVLVLRTNSNALVNLFTSATLMPAILYAATVLLYVFTAHRVRTDTRFFHLGRWEWPVIIGSLAWLAYELIILIGPASFRPAQG